MSTTSDAPVRSSERGRSEPAAPGTSLLAAVLAEASKTASNGPPWLGALRRDAAHWLEARGFPKPTEEAWRFTPIREILRVPYSRAAAEDTAAECDTGLTGDGTPRVVLVNG